MAYSARRYAKPTPESTEPPGFVLRITREDTERKLFIGRIFYVGIRRDWVASSKAIFVKRLLSGDSFIGSGTIAQFVPVNNLAEPEQKSCKLNNWYGKIVFTIVARFLPPVSGERCNVPVLQTGQQISLHEIEKISAMAETRIIS